MVSEVDLPIERRTLVALLLVLTAVTGIVDAVSYLGLGHVFVANMTGNVVFLGLAIYPGSGLSPVASATAIAAFLAGSLLGGRLGALLAHRPRRSQAVAFTLQAVLLAAATALSAWEVPALALTVPLALAFGLQNATVRRLAARDLTTTVLTMTLTGLAADSVLAGGSGQKPLRRVGSVLVMFAGAAVGALLLRVGVTVTLATATALVAFVAIAADGHDEA